MTTMYNNDVTYDKKWDTPENLKALKKLETTYFYRSICYPSCPAAWAPEVLELLESLDEEFGIQWNTQTIMAYSVTNRWYWLLSGAPFVSLFHSVCYNFLSTNLSRWEIEHRKKLTLRKKLSKVVTSFLNPYFYGKDVFRVQVIAPIVNRLRKPKIRLSQVKEKYGELRVYFTAPEYLDKHIEYLIAKTEVRLALKGAYYPVESLYNNGTSYDVGNKYYVDDVEIEVAPDGSKTRTDRTHRKAMSDLGLDLQDIEQRAIALEKKSDEEEKQKGVSAEGNIT